MRVRHHIRHRAIAAAIVAGSVGFVTGAVPSGSAAAAAPSAPVVGLSATGQLIRFDASRPGIATSTVAITGLQPGEQIVGIDVRPATGELLGIGVSGTEGRVYTIDVRTGVATAIGATPFSTTLPTGGTWSVDVNPTVDRVRVVHSSGLNLRVNQTNGTLAATDTPVTGGAVAALAYDRSAAGSTGTTLYVVDTAADRLASMGSINSAPQSPNGGALLPIGGLGLDATAAALDIAPASSAFAGTAYAALQVSGSPVLATIDLRTGLATTEGSLPAAMIDIAVLAPTPMVALTDTGSLVRFDASSPEVLSGPTAITGLGAAEQIVAFDARPATAQLIGLGIRGGEGRIYAIDASTGAATQIGTTPFATGLPNDGSWTVDFNPTVDRIRVMHSSGLNLRVNPNNGARADAPANDTAISGGRVVAGAYDRSVPTAAVTTLYGIDDQTDRLVTVGGVDSVPSPNGGVLASVGPLGFDVGDEIGFDILPSAAPRGVAAATFEIAASTGLYTIDLATGTATLRGVVGDGTTDIRDIAALTILPTWASQFTPTTPTRLLDTREGGRAKPIAGESVRIQVTGTVVPANATAVVMNVVGTEATADGFLTAFPTGDARPLAANQNLTTGGTRGNLVTVKIGAGGGVDVFTQSGAHLVADVYGYYAPPTGTAGRFTPLVPARLLDTRTTAKVPAGGSLDVQVTGAGGVPAMGVASVMVNVTAVDATAPGYITGFAAGAAKPFVASLNADRAGQTIGNLAILPVGAGGKVTLFSQSGTHLTVDVVGWFGDATAKGGTSGLYVPVVPARALDTRVAPATALAAGGTLDLTVAGVSGLPAAGVAAATMNVTAVDVVAPGFVTAYATGAARAEVASLYADMAGMTIPNLVTSQVAAGKVTLFSNAGTHLVVDLAGWFTA